jgi:polysaccharide pyruvyl transferase WcaK-like protein
MDLWGGRPDRVLEAASEAVRALAGEGWRIRYIPMWPVDVESGQALRRASGVGMEVLDDFLDLDVLLDALASCRVFVGQKLHSVILAAAVHTPAVMLEYHPKCLDFQRSVERERWTLRTDAVTRDALLELIQEIDGSHAEQRRRLHATVGDLRRRLDDSAERARRALPAEMR